MIAAFALEGISGGNAVFNPEKLDWINQQYIMRLSTEELGGRLEPYLREAGLWREEFAGARRPWYLAVVELFKPRLTRLTKFRRGGRAVPDDAGRHRRGGRKEVS